MNRNNLQFVKVFDKDLIIKLEADGAVKLSEDNQSATFVIELNKFNFDNIQKNKYIFTNRLTF